VIERGEVEFEFGVNFRWIKRDNEPRILMHLKHEKIKRRTRADAGCKTRSGRFAKVGS
jgi:hypothetical protein